MTKQEIVHLVDDLDGDTAHETVTFGLDGRTYEIDLSDDHASELRDLLSSYVAAARSARSRSRAASRGRSRASGDGPRSRSEARAMRSWARSHGHDLADRGRIPAGIVQAYRDSGGADDGAPTSGAGSSSPADTAPAESASGTSEPTDADVLAWHEAKNYKIPADRTVNGLMRHRYRTAHRAVE